MSNVNKAVEEEVVVKTQSATLKQYRDRYTKVDLPNGKSSLNNGDAVAQALHGRDYKQVMTLAEQMMDNLKKGQLKKRYGSDRVAKGLEALNNGSQRMNAGNILRAAYKREKLEGVAGKVTKWVEAQLKASE